ncbi:leucine-rich repeat domain-containing protein [Aquimarina agarilytica]|uniref:hypothetical protein n=1 Tax=Aquimarina agarilytica TaxID=1087449 RepID=UPI000289CEBA|nr:hypothetical protein [Aquimarina agarilytica]
MGDFTSHPNIDTDGDGEIQIAEAKAVEVLNLRNKGILDLRGIEYFVNLKELYIEHNRLTSLDISKNKQLKELYAQGTLLTTLNIASNEKLEVADIRGGELEMLEVDNCGNPHLRELILTDCFFTNLDKSKFPNLKIQFCNYID